MLTCACAFAQVTGGLRGVITDQSGALVPGAQVTVTSADGIAKEIASDADGSYTLNGLAAGKYTVRVTFPGLLQGDPASVDVNNGFVTLNVPMSLALEKQEVTVHDELGAQVTTDPSQSAATLVMSNDRLDALSDDPDDLQADLQALAGPTAGPNGSQFFIDGFTAGDSPLPSKSAIREIRVNQNPFSPEYDAIGFGRTEILTKPGMDKYRAQVYYNYGNALFNSRNPYAAQQAPFDLNDPGGSFGGPLNKHASFFVDVDDRRINNGAVVNAVTLSPAPTLAIMPFTNVFASPNSRFRISPRIDYQFGASNTLTFRYALTRTGTAENGTGGFNLMSRGYNGENVEHAFQATETAILSSKVVDETHFQFLHQHNAQDSPDTDPSITVSSAFNGGGSLNANYYYIHHHYEVQNYVSIAAGRHSWKTGVRLRAVSIQDSSQANFDGTYFFGGAYAPILDGNNDPVVPGVICNPSIPNTGCQTISSIQQYQRTLLGLPGGGATQFSLNNGNPLVRVGQVDVGIFAGDDWRVQPNLTVSLGIRYEGQTNIHDRTDFAPRVAVAWAPGAAAKGARSKTVFRLGYGIFYDRFSEQNTLIAQRFDGVAQQQFVIDNPTTFPAIPPLGVLQQSLSTQAIHTVSPLLVAPYVMQTAAGIERQLPGDTTVAVTYTNSHGLHQLLSRDINAPLPGTYTGVAGSGVYPYGNIGPAFEMESAGLYNQNQVVTNINSRVNAKISLFGFYMLSYARSNTDGVNTYPANQYSLAGEYGPAATDVRHRASIGGSITTFWNLRLSPFIVAQTGAPFNITTSQDIYGDTLANARPGIVTNPNQPGVVKTSYGLLDPDPAPGETLLPRNFGRGPGLFSVDLRLAKTFALRRERKARSNRSSPGAGGDTAVAAPPPGPSRRGGIGGFDNTSTAVGDAGGGRNYNLTASVSARNIFNHVNPGPVIGDINSPLFGQSNAIAGGVGAFSGNASNRRLEFQLRLAF